MVLALLRLSDRALGIVLPRFGSVVCAHMRLGDACPMGLRTPWIAITHGQQHGFWVNRLCCTGCASTGTLGTLETSNTQFGHGWGVIFSAFGVFSLALNMLGFALTSLGPNIGCERMVCRQDGLRLLDWGLINDRSKTKAASMKMGYSDVVNVIEAVGSTLELWKFPPRSTGRPLERPSATSFGDSICERNEGLDEPSAVRPAFLNPGTKSRA